MMLAPGARLGPYEILAPLQARLPVDDARLHAIGAVSVLTRQLHRVDRHYTGRSRQYPTKEFVTVEMYSARPRSCAPYTRYTQ